MTIQALAQNLLQAILDSPDKSIAIEEARTVLWPALQPVVVLRNDALNTDPEQIMAAKRAAAARRGGL